MKSQKVTRAPDALRSEADGGVRMAPTLIEMEGRNHLMVHAAVLSIIVVGEPGSRDHNIGRLGIMIADDSRADAALPGIALLHTLTLDDAEQVAVRLRQAIEEMRARAGELAGDVLHRVADK